MSTTEGRVLKVVAQTLGVGEEVLSVETNPDTLSVWDSLSHLQLILALESEFAVRFTDQDVTDMLSIRLILLVLAEHGVGDG